MSDPVSIQLLDDDQSKAMQQYVKWLAFGSTATTVGTLVSAGLML